MATPSDVSVGLAHELTITVTKVGWEPKDIADLAHSEAKALQVLNYLRGLSEIKPIAAYLINCNADPFVPSGWTVEEHQKGGIFTWDPGKVKLYLSKKQKRASASVGDNLRKELKSQPILNANVLDYLLKPENQHLIPEEWKSEYVFFWGTIYRDSGDNLFVRCLFWRGGRWRWCCHWLGGSWNSGGPAAVLAS